MTRLYLRGIDLGGKMNAVNAVRAPRSLRSPIAFVVPNDNTEIDASLKVTVACLVAAGSITGAEAQQSPLPPVTIDAPVTRPRPPAAKPTPEQIRVRNELRRLARERQKQEQAAPKPAANTAGNQPPDRNPYADPAAPYKADRVASPKFTEPLANTPRTVTVLTKEILEDKNATALKEIGRSTAGVTLGTGEGGSAFGDRFSIRGFDARNDVFIDGVRDPGVSIRENFFTEQIEILRGPASSFAGRGTTGGAINIVTKQATDRDFYNAESTLGTDATRRITIDANQVISPTFSMRVDGMFQKADVAGRDYVFDDRWGGLVATKWTPSDSVKITANYIHTDLDALPDFGVPYNKPALAPWTDTGVPRNTFYGFVNRDFQKTKQDIATINGEFQVNDNVTVSNKLREGRSVLNYIGTLPEQNGNPPPPQGFVNLNPQSRYQVTDVTADQTDATIKFDTGPIRNIAVIGSEISRERVSIDSYTGLASEAIGPSAFTGSGSLLNVSVLNPPNLLPFNGTPTLTGNPTVIPVDTKSVYWLETANYRDFLILNGGIRYDDYDVSATKTGKTVALSSGLVNYNAGIVVKPLPFASVYAAYATSANPVGAEIDGTSSTYGGLNPTATINQIFAPQRNKAYEVGTKWELFDRHFLVTAALFRTETENAREVVPTGLPGAGTIVAGNSSYVQGIDIEAAGKITDRWSVLSGLVLMQSDVTKSVVPTDVGDKLANIAHQSFTTLTKYQLTDNLEIGGQAIYASKIYGGTLLAANQGTVLPEHWRFDAFVEYKINKNWTTKFFVNNIFNKTYYDAFYQSAAPFVLIAPGRAAYWIVQAKL
jgi:catecholate siderophore receptor